MNAVSLWYLAPLAYLLGSIPFGVIFARLAGNKNLQQTGSGNIGATNVARTVGKKWAFLTLIGDLLKGVAPPWIGSILGMEPPHSGVILPFLGLLAVIGHMFPIWLKFKGGKGVATTCGVFLFLAPKALLPAFAVFIILAAVSGYISLGSLGGASSIPIVLWILGASWPITILGVMVTGLIFFTHRENIRRLLRGK